MQSEDVPATDSDVIGFVFPIYHWTLHEAACMFIERLQLNPSAYIFAVSTLCRINGFAFEVLDPLLHKRVLCCSMQCVSTPWQIFVSFILRSRPRSAQSLRQNISSRKLPQKYKATKPTVTQSRLAHPHDLSSDDAKISLDSVRA